MRIKSFLMILIYLFFSVAANAGQFSSSLLTFKYIDSCGNAISDDGSKLRQVSSTHCTADLLARELSVNGLGYFGHVGMSGYLEQDKVLEVSNDSRNGIYWDSFASFKQVPNRPFWGEKFGIKQSPKLEITQANHILDVGNEQRLFPFTYTFSWNWHPGRCIKQQVYNQHTHQWVWVNAVRGAQFRCDSFIYYCYFSGAGLRIFPEFHYPFVPRDMFQRFLTCRNNEGLLCRYHALNYLKERQLSYDITQTESLLKSTLIPRITKITLIWNQAVKSVDNENRFCYLLDSLAYLRPIELVPDIIKMYQTNGNLNNKIHLLNLLVESIQNQQIINITNIVLAQNFIRQILLNSGQEEIVGYIAKIYPNIMPPDQAEHDLSQITFLLTPEQQNWVKFIIAFSNKEYQIKKLPELMNINNASQLCFFLNKMSSDQINEVSKIQLSHFLFDNQGQLINRCNWLSAYATVNTHSDNEKSEYILKYIHGEPDLAKQAKWLTQLNYELFQHIPLDEKLSYRNRLLSELKTFPLKSQNKSLLYAVSALH